jgi:hypothetical protein
MTATSRFKTETPIPQDRDTCLVALVGFPTPLPTNVTRVLERCELAPLEFADAAEACRLLETLAVDAMVLDSHCSQLQRVGPSVMRLLKLSAVQHRAGTVRTPVVVLPSRRLSSELRLAFDEAGALFLPVHRQTYREIATVVRRLCGLPDGCCGPLPPASL